MAVHPRMRLVVLVVAVLGVLAACATPGTTATGAPGPSTTPSPVGLTVIVTTSPAGIPYLTDGAGRALYRFMSDTGTTSTCAGACATAWPPLSGAADGASLTGTLTTTTRADGSAQAVYNGHPLYYFKGDTAAGQTNGEGVNGNGGLWYLIDPVGNAITSGIASAAPIPAGGGY